MREIAQVGRRVRVGFFIWMSVILGAIWLAYYFGT